jgi:hypothetical protein
MVIIGKFLLDKNGRFLIEWPYIVNFLKGSAFAALAFLRLGVLLSFPALPGSLPND